MKRTIFMLLLGLLFVLPVHAGKTGNHYLIIAPTLINYKNKMEEGTSPSQTVTYPVTFAYEYNLDRVNRLRLSFRGIDARFPAGSSGIGADVEGYQLSYTWLRKIRFARQFKPWLGLGLSSGFIEETNRIRTDVSGFVVENFENKDVTSFAVTLNAHIDWEIAASWLLDVGMLIEIPVSEGLSGYGLGVGLKYNF